MKSKHERSPFEKRQENVELLPAVWNDLRTKERSGRFHYSANNIITILFTVFALADVTSFLVLKFFRCLIENVYRISPRIDNREIRHELVQRGGRPKWLRKTLI